jgi:hemin uptake protein HemP
LRPAQAAFAEVLSLDDAFERVIDASPDLQVLDHTVRALSSEVRVAQPPAPLTLEGNVENACDCLQSECEALSFASTTELDCLVPAVDFRTLRAASNLPTTERDLGVAAVADAAGVRRIDSAVLFAAARELQILHGHELYRLTQTRNGKLILTK